MNLNITGKDFELTDAIKNYIETKVNKLSKYSEDFNADAIMKIEGNNQVAEIRVSLGGNLYKAVTASHDLYASVDKDIDIIEGQIRKTKTKKDKQNMTETIRFKEAMKDDDLDEYGGIIKTIFYSIKPMTEEDAKLILEGDPKNKFLPFIDADTNTVKVIYKLKDGKNFGLLEPEN